MSYERVNRIVPLPGADWGRRLRRLGVAATEPQRKENIFMRTFLAGLLMVACVGCGQEAVKDRKAMNLMVQSLSAACSKALSESDYTRANNLALVTCVFAREVNCVNGKSPMRPTPELAMKSTEPTEQTERSIVILGGTPVSCAVIWKQVQEIALQASHEVKGLDSVTYAEILSSVLSKEEMTQLSEMRKRLNYYSQVEQTLK